jgi:hypothetical protein
MVSIRWREEQLCLFPECRHKSGSTTHAPESLPGVEAQLPEVSRTEVWQGVVFSIPLEVLEKVQLRRIARKEFHSEAVPLRREEFLDEAAPVRRQPIPDQDDLAANMAEQMSEKLHDLRGLDRAREQAKVDVP